jgi:hypothetical protein
MKKINFALAQLCWMPSAGMVAVEQPEQLAAPELADMARKFSERNETIRDTASDEVLAALFGNSNQQTGVTFEVFTNQTLNHSEKLERLMELEDWADQFDNGFELFHHGGLDHLINILTTQSLNFQVPDLLKAAGRVFAAAVQNNDKTQAALLQARPGTLRILAAALDVDSPWVLTAASALLRRTPEVHASEEALAADEVFKAKLLELLEAATVPEWLGTRGRRLLDILDYPGNLFSLFPAVNVWVL